MRAPGRELRRVGRHLLVPGGADPHDEPSGGTFVGSRLVLILLLPVDRPFAGFTAKLEVERRAAVAAVEQGVELRPGGQRADEGEVELVVEDHPSSGAAPRVLEVAGADCLGEAVCLILWVGQRGYTERERVKRERERMRVSC